MEQIEKLFDDKILPISSTVRLKEPPYFKIHPIKEAGSYFQSPKNHGKEYFSFFDNETEFKLTEEFKTLWASMNCEELVQLAPDLSRLAFDLEEQNEKQNEEISDFVYVMF